ncbi:hypothetical protein ACULNC_06200 [Shigella flexneri]
MLDAICWVSLEWQALQADCRIQAQLTSSICLAGRRVKKRTIRLIRKEESQTLLLRATRMDNSDTLWITRSKMKARQPHYPLHWRTILPNWGDSPAMLESSARSLYGPLDWMGDAAK